MPELLYIGSAPSGESCAQVGQPGYTDLALKECKTFIAQLRRVFGPEPDGASLRIKAAPHDFGTYHEVVIRFDEDNPQAVRYAYRTEAQTPEYWDTEAKRELRIE